jgi:hypothetical protein
MLATGEKITVRNMLSRIGGKTATIAGFLRLWHMQNSPTCNNSLSQELLQAILNDRNVAIAKALSDSKFKLKNLDLLLQELNDKFKAQELEINNKEKAYHLLKEQYTNELAMLQARLKQQLHSLQDKLTVITEEKHEAVKQAAVWQTKYEQSQRLKERVNRKT